MKSCRECKALNPQVALVCEYCSETLPTAAPISFTSLSKYNLSALLKRRLVYLAVAVIIVLLAELARR